MPKKAPGRVDHLRCAIAQEAARLMVEHGIQDYLVAKRKAAERYGMADNALLPKNTEIETALFSYQRLFGGTQHERRLKEQRGAALQAMRLLQQFDPRLVGPVLTGSATEHADIQLHVFADNPDAIAMHLMDRRYDYEVFERKLKMTTERQVSVPSLRFNVDEEPIEAFVFPKDGIRQAPIGPVDGRPMRRAGMQEVSELERLSPD